MKTLFFSALFSFFMLAACHSPEKGATANAYRASLIDTAGGSCPYLTKDDQGNIVLSWIRQRTKDTPVFCYAVSLDQGATFSAATEIPGSGNVQPHGENAPKILFKPSGEMIAAWGVANPNPKNKYSGLVFYSQSFNRGRTWSRPRPLTGDTASFDQRYFDMALLPGGEAGIVWLDNRRKGGGEGSGLYYAVTQGRDGFQAEKQISGPCCQCCRTDLFIDAAKNIHVLYRAIIEDTIRDMVHIVSTNGGRSFSAPERISKDNWVISGCPHTGPAMTENREGLHFAWFTGGAGAGIYYNNLANGRHTFTPRDTVSGRTAMHCQIAALPNDDLLIVWNESFSDGKQLSSRIGLEERTASGTRKWKEYITAPDSQSSFPVLCALGTGRALVAYTESIHDREQVSFRQVMLQ